MVSEKCLLVPFKYSHKVAFMLEFSHKKIRIYAQGKLLKNEDMLKKNDFYFKTTGIGEVLVNGNQAGEVMSAAVAERAQSEYFEIASPYSYADLWDEEELCWKIQTIQNGDVLYVFNAKFPIMTLKRYANTDWRLEELPILKGPFLPVNTTDISIKGIAVDGRLHLQASADLFKETDVMRLVRLRGGEDNVLPWTSSMQVKTNQICYSDKKYYRAVSEGTTGTNKPVHTQGVRSDGGVRWRYAHDGWGIVQISEYISPREVAVYWVVPLAEGAVEGTTYWELGLLHSGAEYPISGAFFRNRFAFLVNTDTGPQVCFSVNGDYDNFLDQEFGEATAESAITVPVLNTEFNEGKWLFAGDVLFVGTGAAEFYIDAVSPNAAMASDNIKISQISNVGSKPVMPVAVGAHIFFTDRYGLSLRDLTYNYYNDGYDQMDISLLGKHLFFSRIVAMSYQEVPDKVLWCLMGDGTLTALTFSAEQEVAALSRHDFSGAVESIAVIPNLEDCRDELWLSLRRIIDGETVRTVEWMDNGMPLSYPFGAFKSIQETNLTVAEYTLKQAMYLDAAVKFERGDDDVREVISGLQHLEGKQVLLFADGVVLPPQIVMNGKVSIKKTYAKVWVGLPVRSQFIPQSIYVGNEGSSGIGQKQRINHLLLMLYLSGGGKIGQDEKTLCEILYRTADAKMNSPRGLFSGNKEVLFNGSTNVDEQAVSILIENESPLPMNILAIVPAMDVS
ncbi:MAG: hypothetical protein NC218_10970 [Acetobacter sp.]|nr:hypothetical protein [Acetobacter sp.]